MDFRQSRRLLLLVGVVVIVATAAVMAARGVDMVEVWATVLFLGVFVAAAMWQHGPGMAETMRSLRIDRPRFTGSEFRDLMAYFQSVSEAVHQGPMYVLPGRADVGRELFSSKSCLRCHSVRGSGGQIGPPLGGRGL